MKCYRCDKEGHGVRDCPEPDTRGTTSCNRCGAEGHFVRDCPQPEKQSQPVQKKPINDYCIRPAQTNEAVAISMIINEAYSVTDSWYKKENM